MATADIDITASVDVTESEKTTASGPAGTKGAKVSNTSHESDGSPTKRHRPNVTIDTNRKQAASAVLRSTTMSVWKAPVFMKPQLDQVPRIIDLIAAKISPYIKKEHREFLASDLKGVFRHNLVSRVQNTYEKYVPSGYLHIHEELPTFWLINKLVDAYSPYDDHSTEDPPLLLDATYLQDTLMDLGILQPSGLELVFMRARCDSNLEELKKRYPNIDSTGSRISLLRAGVLPEVVGQRTFYYPVSCEKLARTEELLVGALRLRGFMEYASGTFVPRLKEAEKRSMPQLVAYFKSGEAYSEDYFVFEILDSMFRRS